MKTTAMKTCLKISSINDQDCGNILFYLQYLPDMINWLKFVHSRLDGRLRNDYLIKIIEKFINIMLNHCWKNVEVII